MEIQDRADQQFTDIENTFSAQFAYKRVDLWANVIGSTLTDAERLNSYLFTNPLDNSDAWYGPIQSQTFPIVIPADPSNDAGWAIVDALTTTSGDNRYTATFKNDAFGSAVENMIAYRINGVVSGAHSAGNKYFTGGTAWKYNAGVSGTIDDFKALITIYADDFISDASDASLTASQINQAFALGGKLKLREIYQVRGVVSLNVKGSKLSGSGGLISPDAELPAYGMLSLNAENITVKDITLDGNQGSALYRGSFGSDSVLNIGSAANNFLVENVKLQNTVYSCVTANGLFKSGTFRGLKMKNIGEHPFYMSAGDWSGLLIEDIDIYDWGCFRFYNPTDPTHASLFVKSRSDTYGDNEDLTIRDVRIRLSSKCTEVPSFIIPTGLKNMTLDNIRVMDDSELTTSVLNSASSTSCNVNMNLMRGFSQVTFGASTYSSGVIINVSYSDFGVHPSQEYDGGSESQLFSITSAKNCTWRFTNNTSRTPVLSPVEYGCKFEDCKFTFTRQVNYNISSDILPNKYIKYINCHFFGDSPDSTIFMNVTDASFAPSLIEFRGCGISGNTNNMLRFTVDTNNTPIQIIDCPRALDATSSSVNFEWVPIDTAKQGLASDMPYWGNVGKGKTYYQTDTNKMFIRNGDAMVELGA